MKNLRLNLFIISVAPLFFGCGSKELQDAKNAYEVISKSPEIAKNLEENMNKAAKKREERKKKGDTLAINYKKLQEYLPSKIEGYEKDGEMKGESTSMQGLSISQAECNFKKGENKFKIAIADYNGAYEMYGGLTAMWSTGINIEDDEKKIEPFTLTEDAKGLQTTKKKEKEIEIVFGIGERFFVTVRATGTDDIAFVKSVLKTMDIDALAKM